MGKESATATRVAHATRRTGSVQKHKKKTRYERGNTPSGLVARPAVPKLKHKTIFEWAENTDKKKKLEIEVTKNRNPPPSFTFVPVGNPELTNICKELSRERGALVYIVSTTEGKSLTELSDHVHRLGYHFRTQILEEARASVDDLDPSLFVHSSGKGDPIPDEQEDINKQADAAIRDLFPRIPHTDREMIIQHAFQKGAVFNGKPVVGLQRDLTLSRRVQLAVIAHIRHTHTRYDLLLRETTWENARKTIEPLTLDILVKWRGDEETGRDQLDEVLREIVIIDDSDDEEEDDDEEEEDSDDELEEGEVSEAEAPAQEKTPAAQVISLISSPIRPPSQTLSTDFQRMRPQEPAISSRTRSKTSPKPTKINKKQNQKKGLSKGQAKRARRRQRAWQAALMRSNQQSSTQNITMGVDNSGPGQLQPGQPGQAVSNKVPTESDYTSLPPDFRDRPYNQSIYAIDDRPPARRPRTILLPSTQPLSGPSTPTYGEHVNLRLRAETGRTMNQGYGYEPRPVSSGPVPLNEPRTVGGYLASPRGHPDRERVLPSVEQRIDHVSERGHLRTPPTPGRHSQVMYSRPEPSRGLPAGSNIVYIDDDEHQPKRQRLVLANGKSLPIYDDPGDGYLHPVRNEERAPIYVDGSSDHLRRRAPAAGAGRQEVPFISDDGRRLVRVTRHPEPEVYPRDQFSSQPPVYISRRAEDQLYVPNARPTPSMHESRPVEFVSAGRAVYGESSHAFQRPAPERSNYLSTFPNHSQSQSHETNSGVISYSRRLHEPESRFLQPRHESQVGRIQPSPQFSTERYPIEHPDRGAYRREDQPRHLDDRLRNEQVYVPVDAYGRVIEGTRPPPQDMIRAPTYHRDGEVIVLD